MICVLQILIGVPLLFLGTSVTAQTAANERTAGVALGRRIDPDTASQAAFLRRGDARASLRLRTRIESRLQTRIERFAPARADAAYAYRIPTDDGSRRAPVGTRPESPTTLLIEQPQSNQPPAGDRPD